MYVWDLLDKCELLNTTLSTLSSEQSATSEASPLTVPASGRKGKHKASEVQAEERASFLKTIERFNVGQLLMAKSQVKNDLVHWKLQEMNGTNPEMKALYGGLFSDTQKELSDVVEQINRISN